MFNLLDHISKYSLNLTYVYKSDIDRLIKKACLKNKVTVEEIDDVYSYLRLTKKEKFLELM